MKFVFILYKPMKSIFHTSQIVVHEVCDEYNLPYIWIYIFAMDESSYDIHGNMFCIKFKLVRTLTTFPCIPYYEYKTWCN
jgi:hypothetical protein